MRIFKIISILLIILLSLGLFTGCGDENEKSTIPDYKSDKKDEKIVDVTLIEDSLTYRGCQIEIKNLTDGEVTYDMTFILEQKTDSGWERINKDQYFTALGCVLKPDTTDTKALIFDKNLEAGTYRITKDFTNETSHYTYSFEFKLI